MIDWQRIWNDDEAFRRFSPTRAILFLFSLLYGLAVSVRNSLYDAGILKSVKLSCPVISVGNITVGGTGKTPCVIYLAKMLQRHGFCPAIVSRGYGGKNDQPVNVVSDGKAVLLDAQTAGDEPLLMACSLPNIPVIIGPRRELTGRAAIERFGANVVICDDAFQHRRIFRDIDIVLLDGSRPLGNGHLLPRGELREPVGGIRRAGCVVFTRADHVHAFDEDVLRITRKSNIPVYRAFHRFTKLAAFDGVQLTPDVLRDKKVCAFSGIARPESFRKMLLDLHAKILYFEAFPDHYVFTRYDAEDLKNKFLSLHADYLVTTEKDAMRLSAYPELAKMVCVLRMDMEISPPESFENFMVEWLEAVGSRDER